MGATNKTFTVSEIAASAGVARHRVKYAIDKLGLEPIRVAGTTKLFDRPAVERLVGELKQRAAQAEVSVA